MSENKTKQDIDGGKKEEFSNQNEEKVTNQLIFLSLPINVLSMVCCTHLWNVPHFLLLKKSIEYTTHTALFQVDRQADKNQTIQNKQIDKIDGDCQMGRGVFNWGREREGDSVNFKNLKTTLMRWQTEFVETTTIPFETGN